MSVRRTSQLWRAVATATMVTVLAFAATGCGSDGGGKEDKGGASSATKTPTDDGGKQGNDTAAGENVDPNAKLAVIRGQGDVTLTINQVQRDTGGFVTVQGVIKNDGDQAVNPAAWAGSESSIISKNLNSVGGAALVDKAGKKRYAILRDTDGNCLCTTKIRPLQAGTSTPVFMQFPAPPASTTEVDFSLPTFTTTSLKING
ncbi:hypothetical protein AB0M42_21190 [Streptomyces sp. NPDC051784]|uniref:hypothetical protein n=1 Tax=Streptomyces sp. NPDC051784 TaxID=3155805 RepID=UPI0034363DC5